MQFFHIESNGGIFMSVSSLQHQKDISKFWPVIFVGFLDHLGIKNKCIVFIFGMCIVEISLHNISSGFLKIRKRVDFIDIFFQKNYFSKILRLRNKKIENPR